MFKKGLGLLTGIKTNTLNKNDLRPVDTSKDLQHLKFPINSALTKQLTIKYFQLALLSLIIVAKGYGQTGSRSYGVVIVEITKEKKSKKIYTKVTTSSPFPIADSTWAPSLAESLNRSITFKKKRARAGQYIVEVRFLIERDGNMTDIRCVTDPGFGLCEQVAAAITKKYYSNRPKWGPRIEGQ
jgi:hypothetical protein